MDKICVYTIAKNEEKFARRWARSCIEADYRVVADTGSEDNTIEILKNEGVTVHRIIVDPWRYDEARNMAMKLVPKDVTVFISMDMDEILIKGWRQELDLFLKSGRPWTFINCSFVTFWANGTVNRHFHERIHNRDYVWKNRYHERPFYRPKDRSKGKEIIEWCTNIHIEEHPDETKDRTCNLPLLELAVKEDDEVPRQWKLRYFLADMYMKTGHYAKAIKTAKECYDMKETWEKCKSELLHCIIFPSIDKLENDTEK